MSDQNLAGYVLYLLMVFLPGIGLGESLRLWRDGDSLVERSALAFGLGLAFDSIVLFVRTSGASFGGVRLEGIDLSTIYLIIGAGAVLILASGLLQRRFAFYVKPRRTDLAAILVVLGLCTMLIAYFTKYPIFPEYQSPDFANHVFYSASLVTGHLTSIPLGILYYGIEYQIAASFLLVGGPNVVTARDTMALLVAISPILLYLGSNRLFSSRIAALFVASVYAFSGTLWFDSVFNAGLFANFFGFLASLMLIVAFIDVSGSVKSATRWVFFTIVVAMAYLSHYSTLTVLPAMIIVGLLYLAKSHTAGLRYLIPAVVPALPVVAIAVSDPKYVGSLLSLALAGGGQVNGSTTASSLLASIPVLQYMAVEVYDDLAFLVLFVLTAVYLYRTGIERNWLLLIPFFWFVSVLVASPEDIDAWRFSFAAILPLLLMAGEGISFLLPRSIQTVKRSGYNPPRSARPQAILTAVVLLCLLVIGSWGTTMLSDASTSTQLIAQSQQDVLGAINWLGNNTASSSVYLSVSDWRFTYTDQLISRSTFYQFESTPQQAVPVAKADGADFIIVTNLITASIPSDPSLFPWNNFSPSSNMTLIYSNNDVEVFQIT